MPFSRKHVRKGLMSEEHTRPRVVFGCIVSLQATVNDAGPAARMRRSLRPRKPGSRARWLVIKAKLCRQGSNTDDGAQLPAPLSRSPQKVSQILSGHL